MLRVTSPFQHLRRFSTGANLGMPLQPLKQRKTTPIRNPRRPHLPDPIETDPSAQKFKLLDHPEAIFVIREPTSMANLTDDLFHSNRINHQLYPPASVSPSDTNSSSPEAQDRQQTALSHPVLSTSFLPSASASTSSSSDLLPPRLRNPKVYPNSITPETLNEIQALRETHSLTQLSKKFGVSRILIAIVGAQNESIREQIQIKNQMRRIRKESKWSVAKTVRRQEKMIRRSMW